MRSTKDKSGSNPEFAVETKRLPYQMQRNFHLLCANGKHGATVVTAIVANADQLQMYG